MNSPVRKQQSRQQQPSTAVVADFRPSFRCAGQFRVPARAQELNKARNLNVSMRTLKATRGALLHFGALLHRLSTFVVTRGQGQFVNWVRDLEPNVP